MIQAKELRIGNLLQSANGYFTYEVTLRDLRAIIAGSKSRPIPLTEERLLGAGYSVVSESSTGKMYAYMINGVFNSDLTLVFWKDSGKIFRGDLEIKYYHQLQNLYFALTGEEL